MKAAYLCSWRLMGWCLVLVAVLASAPGGQAQELNCRVQIQRPNIQGVDLTVFTNMEKEITEFMNNTRWTQNTFLPEERIRCSMTIIFTDLPQNTRFSGTLQVQAIRPVYNSTHETVVLNYLDKDFTIDYTPFQTVQYSENSYVNNLSSILTYYALMILGFDYDTFSNEGGIPFFERARNVVNLAQTGSEGGWTAMSGSDRNRNRYWLMENLLNNSYKSIHSIYYKYHRLGFDKMHENIEDGRAVILECVLELQKLFINNPNAIIVRVFLDAKSVVNSSELIQIFRNAQDADKKRFVTAMKVLDAKNGSSYDEILKSNG